MNKKLQTLLLMSIDKFSFEELNDITNSDFSSKVEKELAWEIAKMKDDFIRELSDRNEIGLDK